MKKSGLTIGFVFITMLASQAQTTDLWQVNKTKFPDEPAIFIERSEVMTISIKGDSLDVYTDQKEDILHLKEQTEGYSSRHVYGSHFNQVKDIKAKTLVWDKSRYKEMNVSDFKKKNDRDDGIFYDDSYYYAFNYPSIASHNRTQLEYRTLVKDPKFISGFVFSSYMPQLKTSFIIKAPKEVEISYSMLNDKQGVVHFKKYEKSGTVYYEWTAEDVASLKHDDGSPSIRYYVPHVVCYVKSYTTKKGKVNVLSNTDDLYRWCYTFIENLNKEQSPEMVSIVEKIKTESKNEEEVVKNVFYWVQNNIKYIAFEDGMRGLTPHNGNYVCEKRYGDCKDMANLIVNLLDIAGVKAYHTWIGTRDLPYKYTEVPTPLVDNHMIATYITKDGQYIFLDGTGDHTKYGFPSSMIQGKEALIGIDRDHYEIKTVPEIPKEKSVMVDSISLALDENMIVGKGTTSLRGYPKVFGGYELDRAEEADVKKYVTRLVGRGSNKFYLDNYTVSNLKNNDLPTKINYSFRIADYFQKIGDEIYVNLNLNKDYYNAFINVSLRKSPRELDYKYTKEEFYTMSIPSGYEVEYLPPNEKFDNELLGYTTEYKQSGQTISFTKTFYLNYLMMQPDQFNDWNDAVKKVSEAYKESIILKKK
ncbi:MAG TPA: transglutaminase domain-containing protein [Chryseolinea sp.]|nr:transglutaminase domain-containing protein [Chryseolinea sp.]